MSEGVRDGGVGGGGVEKGRIRGGVRRGRTIEKVRLMEGEKAKV